MTLTADPIRTLCIDDHPLILAGVRAILEGEPDFLFEGGASTGEAGIALFREVIPDVTLIDLRLGGTMTGVEVIASLSREYPGAKLIALTSYKGDEDIRRALAAGAMGYLLKDLMHKDLLDAIRKVAEGKSIIAPSAAKELAAHVLQTGLTRRELEVLKLVASGQANKSIGALTGVSEETVKFHLKNILSKLGAKDRTHAVGLALKRGLLHLDW